MRAVLRRTRYGSLLAFHIFLLCAAGRNPTEEGVSELLISYQTDIPNS
jgi:hypothetical protein